MPMGNLPGRIGNFIQGAARGTKNTAGRIGNELKEGFGFGESEIPEEEQLYGINPRRAYWANVMADFSNMAMGQPYQNSAMQGQANQKLFQNKMKQQKQQNAIQMMNAMKQKDQTPNIVREAKFMHPDDPEAQRKFIEDYRKKSGVQVNMGQEWQDRIMGDILDTRGEAVKANRDIRRYDAMLELIPSLGNTGGGAEAMTTFRSTLEQFGLGELSGAIDAVGKAAGIDVFSGDQGARELFRALSNQDIVGRARELYPVSNSDIQLLKQMTATLSGQSDPKALEALIKEQRNDREQTIQHYEWMRGLLPEEIPAPPPVQGGRMDLQGVGTQRQELEELRKKHGF